MFTAGGEWRGRVQIPLVVVGVLASVGWVAVEFPAGAVSVLAGIAATLAFGPVVGISITLLGLHALAVPVTLLTGLLTCGTLLPLLVSGRQSQQLPDAIVGTSLAFGGVAGVLAVISSGDATPSSLEQALIVLAGAGLVSYVLHRYELVTVRGLTTTETGGANHE